MEGALAMAAQIASKSPVAVQGTKDNLSFSRFYFHDDEGGVGCDNGDNGGDEHCSNTSGSSGNQGQP